MATGYEKNINDRIRYMNVDRIIAFCEAIGATITSKRTHFNTGRGHGSASKTTYTGMFDNNISVKMPDGKTYEIHNTNPTDNDNFNRYDIIAMAKAAGLSNKDISDAFNVAYKGTEWKDSFTEEFIAEQNYNTTPAVKTLQDYLNKAYPNSTVKVEVLLNEDGEGYNYRLVYYDSHGQRHTNPLPAPSVGHDYNENELSDIAFNHTHGVPNFAAGAESEAGATNANTQTISNAKKGITAIDTALGVDKDGNPVGDGKGIFKSGTDAKVTLAKGPDTSTQVVGNQANNFFTDKNLGTDVISLDTQSNGGAALSEFIKNAQAQKDATTKKTDTQIQKTKSALLSAIQNDDELYKAVSALLQSSDPIGRKAGAALSTAQEANKGYKKTADDSNEQLSGLAAEQRQALYDADKAGLEGYVTQQLDQMMSDLRDESNKADAFTTLASMIAGGINAEIEQMTRQTKDEISKADSGTAKSITGNNVLTTDAGDAGSFLTELISKYVGEDVDLNTVLKGIADSKTQLDLSDVPKSSFKEIPYIDETTLARLQQDPILKEIFSEDYYKKVMSSKNEKDLADEYGIGFLIDSDGDADKSEDFVKMYTDFAKGANAASDKTFNAAQKAYLSALAAGDIKTIQQLTKLADTASAPKSNLYGASALAAQFSQQRQNSNVADSQAYDRVLQQAANDELLAKSKTEGNTSWTSFMGDGNTTTGSSLRGGEVLSGENKNKYGAGYGIIFDAGMKDQSSINDNISTVNDTNRSNSAAVDNNNMANLQKIKSIKRGLLGSRNALQGIVDKGI